MKNSLLALALASVVPATVAEQTSQAPVAATTLSSSEQQLVSLVEAQQPRMLDELRQHVEMNTGTDNIAGLDQYRALLRKELEALGFSTEERSSDPVDILSCEGGQLAFARHLLARRPGKPSAPRILLNGHMDTVFSPSDSFQTLTVEEDGTLHGPGVADMKGGIVSLLYALRALHAHGWLDKANFTVMFNSDEEVGSLGSRALIEELAAEHDIALVFEPSLKHRLVDSRKGLGQVRLKVSGRESHAGAAHEQGVSANLELAHKIIAIEKLTDYQAKTTVNTGTMAGGEKRNTVPGCADAYIDLRYPRAELGEQLRDDIVKIAAKRHTENPAYPALPKTEIWARLHRPVKSRHEWVDRQIEQAIALSQLLGEPILGSRQSGGGTDGSILQAAGLPTLDSIGLDGSGAHSSRERSSIQSLYARSKLIAVMIARLSAAENN